MLATLTVLGPVLYPILATLSTSFIGWASLQISSHLGLAKEGKANETIQKAIENFAGDLALRIKNGDVSMVDVASGKAVPALANYLGQTVAGSLAQFAPIAAEQLQTMLNGKLAKMPVVAVEPISTIEVK